MFALFEHFGNMSYCYTDFDFSWCMDVLFFGFEGLGLTLGVTIIIVVIIGTILRG